MLASGNKVEQHNPDGQRFITGHAQPKLIEAGEEKPGLVRFLKADLIPEAAEIGDPGKMQAYPAAVIVAAPQALGGFGEQVLGEISGAGGRAQFGFQHMLMADAFREAGGGGLYVDAVQHLVKQHAVDAAPDPAQLERCSVPKLGDGQNPGAVKPLLHALADAIDLL